MTYYYRDIDSQPFGITRHIIVVNDDSDNASTFPLTDDNPNTPAFEAWVAEGNTPEPWPES